MKRKVKWGGRLIAFFVCSLFFMSMHAQVSVSGTVFDSQSTPLIGASVAVKGMANGTITDIDGKYLLKVPNANVTLVFSFIGYEKQEIALKGRTTLKVVLKDNAKVMEEVVVVGYGTQKKVSVTGAVSQVSAKELAKTPYPNVSQMLAGKMPGLVSRQESGQPGSDDATLYVRGLGTWGDSSPMILVDGVERAFNNLDPNEIESIAILKDASAAAVYGVKGANGVILVTTKRGSEQKAKISYSGTVTMSQNTSFPEFLDGEEYAYWYNYAEKLNGRQPLFTESDINKIKNGDPNGNWGNTNWYDLLFKKAAITQQHNVSVNGGNQNMRYFLSLGYLGQEGAVKNVDFDRYNLRMNVDASITKEFTVSVDASGRIEDRNNPALSDFTGSGNTSGLNLVDMMMRSHPYINAYDKNGNPMASSISISNPLAARDLSGNKNMNSTFFNGSLAFKYEPSYIKGLSMKFTSSYDVEYTTSKNFFTPLTLSVFDPRSEIVTSTPLVGYGTNAQLTEGTIKNSRLTFQEQINYSRTIAGKHNLGFLFVAEQSKWQQHKIGAYVEDFDFNDLPELSFGKKAPNKPTGSSQELPRVGFVGRLNYDYNGKYLAEVSARADASTVFAKEHRWGYFPAVSLGWRLSEEKFIKDNFSFIDNLKLRASAGILGNDRINPFMYLRTMGVGVQGSDIKGTPTAVIGGVPVNGIYTLNVPNYDITWEHSYNYNAGLDATLWHGLLSIEFDAFYKKTKDILKQVTSLYPPSVGNNYPDFVNMGIVENKGVELALEHKNKLNEFTYSVRGNISYAKNRVLRTDESANIPDYQRQIGRSLGLKEGFIADGLFKTDEEAKTSPTWSSTAKAGDIKYRDLNGDGKITYDQDRTIIGKSNIPEMMFGLNLSAGWRGFDFSALFQGAAICDIALMGNYPGIGWDDTAYTRPFYGNANAPRYLVQGAWTPENPNGKYPRLDTQYRDNNNCASSLWIKDGSYVRLKNVQLGYTIPTKILAKANITALRFYVTGSNLFTISGLDYLDPETPDVNNGYYPQQRTFSFGLNLTF